MSKDEVQALLGEPDDTGYPPREFGEPSIFVYGTVELWFRQQQPRELIGFWWEPSHRGAFRFIPTSIVVDWAFTPRWMFKQVLSYLRKRDIAFDYQELFAREMAMQYLTLMSGVDVSFESGRISGLFGGLR